MKINPNAPGVAGQVDAARSTEKTKAAGKADAAKRAAAGGSEVSISENARLMSQASEAAKAAPDVRADRVEALKQQIASGTYRINSEAVAERLLEDHLNTDFGKNNL